MTECRRYSTREVEHLRTIRTSLRRAIERAKKTGTTVLSLSLADAEALLHGLERDAGVMSALRKLEPEPIGFIYVDRDESTIQVYPSPELDWEHLCKTFRLDDYNGDRSRWEKDAYDYARTEAKRLNADWGVASATRNFRTSSGSETE